MIKQGLHKLFWLLIAALTFHGAATCFSIFVDSRSLGTLVVTILPTMLLVWAMIYSVDKARE